MIDPPAGGGTRRAFSTTVLDQLLSGISNFLLLIAVARTSSPTELGAFTINYTAYVLSLTIARSLVGQPVLISAVNLQSRADAPMRVSLILGAMFMPLGLVVAVVTGQLATGLVITTALPFLMGQDLGRHLAIGRREPRKAVIADGIWLVGTAGCTAAIFLGWATSVVAIAIIWAVSGAISWVYLSRALQTSLRGSASIRPWVLKNMRHSRNLFLDTGISLIVGQLPIVLLAVTSGLSELGAFRAGQTVYSPLNSLYAAFGVAAILQLQHMMPRPNFEKRAILLMSAFPVLGILVVLLVTQIPDAVGEFFIRDNWEHAQRLLLPLGLGQAALAVAVAVGALLRAALATDRILRARVITAPFEPFIVMAGAWSAGAVGAAWGLLLVQGAHACISIRFAIPLLRTFPTRSRASDAHED